MGNFCACLAPKSTKKKPTKRLLNPPLTTNSSKTWTRARSSRKQKPGAAPTQDQVLAAAILFQQQNGRDPFDRTTSLRYPKPGSKNSNVLPRSSSSRARSLTDPLLQPHQLVSENVKLEDIETNHFVLVHGGGFGAWCWYKTIALLEEGGYKATAIDLTGSGVHSFDPNRITSLLQYVQPLTDFLGKLAEGEKVILVGHDFGGACIAYAMELFPFRIAKAIFIAAAMLTNGQNTLDMFSQQAGADDLMRQAQTFSYANGNDRPPTAINFDKSLLRDLFFNQCPAKEMPFFSSIYRRVFNITDVALASVSMRPIPFAPILEKLCLSDLKYGSVQRFYIETQDDNAVPITLQDAMIDRSPPQQVFRLKGADHSPFFSKPQALNKLLIEISKIKIPS